MKSITSLDKANRFSIFLSEEYQVHVTLNKDNSIIELLQYGDVKSRNQIMFSSTKQTVDKIVKSITDIYTTTCATPVMKKSKRNISIRNIVSEESPLTATNSINVSQEKKIQDQTSQDCIVEPSNYQTSNQNISGPVDQVSNTSIDPNTAVMAYIAVESLNNIYNNNLNGNHGCHDLSGHHSV